MPQPCNGPVDTVRYVCVRACARACGYVRVRVRVRVFACVSAVLRAAARRFRQHNRAQLTLMAAQTDNAAERTRIETLLAQDTGIKFK